MGRLLGIGSVGLCVSVGLAACSSFGRGDGDPGGERLALVKSAEVAIPPGARVTLRTADEPQWSACDGKGRAGLSDVTMTVEFTSTLPRQAVESGAAAAMASEGWGRGSSYGNGLAWRRRGVGGATAQAQLTIANSSMTDAYWNLVAFVPPNGQASASC